MPDEAAVEGAPGQPRDALAQAAQDVVERQECAAPELETTASSASVSTELRGRLGPIRASAVEVRGRPLATVFGFSP